MPPKTDAEKAKEKKAKEELVKRAAEVGLPPDASEAEIKKAEAAARKKREDAKEKEEAAEKERLAQEEADAKASMAAKGDVAHLPPSGKQKYALKADEEYVKIEKKQQLQKFEEEERLVGWDPITSIAIVKKA